MPTPPPAGCARRSRLLSALALLVLLSCAGGSPSSPARGASDRAPEPPRDVPAASSAVALAPPPGADATEPSDAPDAPAEASGDQSPAPPCSHVPGVCCVAIQPLGRVPDEELRAVAEALAGLYGFETRILEPVDLPEEAWYEPRRRYRAEKLLDFLAPRLPEGCDRIAGVTVKDISTTKGEIEDWGILGLAELPGVAAVFSTFRCRRRVHDVPAIERLRRVAIHEVGHTLGLPHCPTYGCFLEDAGGKAETIDRETFLCDVCRERLGWID